jgi:hypothetical protein
VRAKALPLQIGERPVFGEKHPGLRSPPAGGSRLKAGLRGTNLGTIGLLLPCRQTAEEAMPLAELVQPQRDNQPQRGKKGAIDRPIGLVTCPNCRVVMPRISLQPSQEENLHEAVYRCPQCGTETRRWIAL